MTKITPFKIEIPEETLDDLRMRLLATRWPDEIPDSGWAYGASLSYMKELLEYWLNQFDWRLQENRINSFNQYLTEFDRYKIHFIHERGKGPRPMPLIITHGWPSSFAEMLKIIPMLTDPASHGGKPEDSFDVIVPSLPGFGFSTAPLLKGGVRVAQLWDRLMTNVLGYPRYAAHGGDIGAGVTSGLGRFHSGSVIGIHITAFLPPYLGEGSAPFTAAEQKYQELQDQWEKEEGGYSHIQGTKPQTLAYGLNDSPIGLAAWIVEKWFSWGDCHGDIESRFTKDELLTNVMIYWATQTINSSNRYYYESRHNPNPNPMKKGERIQVPTGVALTREEVDRAPREWVERTYNLRHWTDMPTGGHFFASEEPALLAEDLRKFFRSLR